MTCVFEVASAGIGHALVVQLDIETDGFQIIKLAVSPSTILRWLTRRMMIRMVKERQGKRSRKMFHWTLPK